MSKIWQIIPAPAGMIAEFNDFNDDGSPGAQRVACLALCEEESGVRSITGVITEGGGMMYLDTLTETVSNFKGYRFAKPEELPEI